MQVRLRADNILLHFHFDLNKKMLLQFYSKSKHQHLKRILCVMKLFGSPVSPFVRKILSYLAERGMEAELVGVGVGDVLDGPGQGVAGVVDDDVQPFP